MVESDPSNLEKLKRIIEEGSSKDDYGLVRHHLTDWFLDDKGVLKVQELSIVPHEDEVAFNLVKNFLKQESFVINFNNLPEFFEVVDLLMDFLELEEIFKIIEKFTRDILQIK